MKPFQASDMDRLVLCECPYRWATAVDFLAPAEALDLERSFPTKGYRLNKRTTGSDKTYCVAINTIVPPGGELQTELPAPWQNLCQELLSDDYRAAMEKLVGLRLAGGLVELTLNVYYPGHWLSPHTDKYPKVATQLFYFGGDWQKSWGGGLHILRAASANLIVQEILPKTGSTVLIVRSEKSWHAVAPVSPLSPSLRRSLQVTFWAKKPTPPPPGRRVGDLDELICAETREKSRSV